MEDPQGQPGGDALKPHPTLDRYYGRSDERPQFVRRMFDATAGDYDRVEGPMALGSGRWYRREALQRAGLGPGMRVLDVAIGTGLVAREAVRLAGEGAGLPDTLTLATFVKESNSGEVPPVGADTARVPD